MTKQSDKIHAKMPRNYRFYVLKISDLGENGLNSIQKHRKDQNSILSRTIG